MNSTYVLTLSCADRPGLVAAVAGLLFQNGGNILDAQQFNDQETGRFFMRVVFGMAAGVETLSPQVATMAGTFGMTWRLRSTAQKQRVLLLVSKFDHCLTDLLYRTRIGELNMEIVGVISNHPREVLKSVMLDDIPFYHLPVTKETKPQQETTDVYYLIRMRGQPS